jgi:FG-GAP-like repeat
MKKLLQSITIILLFSLNTFAQLSFTRYDISITGFTSPSLMKVDDINYDGYKDLGLQFGNFIIIITNSGIGSFQLAPSNINTGQITSFVFSDINNDFNKDISMTLSRCPGVVGVLTNSGLLNFNSEIDYESGATSSLGYCSSPSGVVSNDFNNDGYLDIASINSYGGAIGLSVFLNKGNGLLNNQVYYSDGNTPYYLLSGDVNNDGNIDLIEMYQGGYISIRTNTGNGGFANPTNYTASTLSSPYVQLKASNFTIGDINGDSYLDIILVHNMTNTYNNYTNKSVVTVLTNTGTGNFIEQIKTYDVGTVQSFYFGQGGGNNLAIGDLNGDGNNDLAVTNYLYSTISVLTNTGNGILGNQIQYPTGLTPNGVFINDFNGDSKLDLVVSIYNDKMFASIYFNTSNFTVTSNLNTYSSSSWSLGYPTPSQNILVNSDLVLSSVLGVSNATISSGITLTVPTGLVFTLSGTLTNNGTIVVEDGASLVQATGSSLAGSGTYIIKRNGTSNSTQYNYYSSPIKNGTTAMLGGNSAYVYQYTETSPRNASDYGTGWQSASGNLTVGKGYASAGSGNVVFTGTVNNGNISTPVTYTNVANNITADGWNLVGNPYPSSMDISSFLSANSSVLYTSGVYFWNSSNYVTLNSGSIPSCQGFFVSAKANGNVSFTNNMRTKTNTSLYRVAAKTVLKLSLTNPNGQKDITQIEFTAEGTDGFNPNEDALKLKGNTVLQLYSKARNSVYDLAINTKSNLYLDTTVQLVYDGAVSGTYQLSLDEATNVPDKIWVQDQTTNTVSELKKGTSYTFTGGNTSANQRLVLKLSGARTEILTSNALPSIETKEISIQQKGKDFEIEGNGKLQAQLLDLQGRNLAHTLGNDKLLFSVGMLPEGVYILKVNDELGIKTVKVFIF